MFQRLCTRTITIACLALIMRYTIHNHAGDVIRAYMVLFALVPLVSISLTSRQETYALLAGLLIGAGLILWYGSDNTNIVAATILLVGTIISILYHSYLLSTRSHVRPRAFASVHGSMLCTTFAVAGSLTLMSNSQQRNLTCDSLHNAISTHINPVLMPLRFTQTQTIAITKTINDFFTKSSNDIVTEHLLGGGTQALSATLSSVADTESQNVLASIRSSMPDEASANLFSQFTSELMDRPFSNKQVLDDKLCTVVFDQVTQRSNKP
jgi:hypothetical protein